jgi:hypothetical protein
VSGYAVSDIAYTYGADPNDITNLEFTLDNGAGVVHAQLVGGRLIVPLAMLPELPSVPLDVLDTGSLVMIAQRYDAVILHHIGPGGECFLVVDGDSVFRRYARPAPGWELAIVDQDRPAVAPGERPRLLRVPRRAA